MAGSAKDLKMHILTACGNKKTFSRSRDGKKRNRSNILKHPVFRFDKLTQLLSSTHKLPYVNTEITDTVHEPRGLKLRLLLFQIISRFSVSRCL